MNISDVPTGEVKLLYSIDEGMRICCSRKLLGNLQAYLNESGFGYTNVAVEVPGTVNICDFVEISVNGSNMKELLQTVKTFLNTAGITFTIDHHTIDEDGDENIILSLTNYSVFDR